MTRPNNVVPQLEVQLTRNMETGVGFSVAAYGSLLDGDYNFSADSAAALRGRLHALMDDVVERLAERVAA